MFFKNRELKKYDVIERLIGSVGFFGGNLQASFSVS
jgi:hypothetical protein